MLSDYLDLLVEPLTQQVADLISEHRWSPPYMYVGLYDRERREAIEQPNRETIIQIFDTRKGDPYLHSGGDMLVASNRIETLPAPTYIKRSNFDSLNAAMQMTLIKAQCKVVD